jgi:predicted component of type VI protein secretion system
MVVGRGEDCSLVLEGTDQAASRRHATITVDGPVVAVEDSGSTNGVFVNEVRVERTMLRPGDVLRLGKTVLTIETAAPVAAPPPGHAPAAARPGKTFPLRLVLYLAALAALVIWLGFAVLSGDDASPPPVPAETPLQEKSASDGGASGEPEPVPSESGAPAQPSPPAETPAAGPPHPETFAPTEPGKPAVSPEGAEKSQEHGRQAIFFYNSGKIGLAIGEWEKAVTLDPGNSQAAKWLARAEGERDQLLDKHFREGLASLKYSRWDEAVANFRFVVELCRENTEQRCRDAARHLEELERKKP